MKNTNKALLKFFFIMVSVIIYVPLNANADMGTYYLKNYFNDTMAIKGYTGYVAVPSSEVLRYKNFNLGIHKYNVGFNCGVIPRGEIGFVVKVDEINMLETTELNIKYKVFPFKQDSFSGENPSISEPKVAIGIKGHTFYCTGGKHFKKFYHFGLQGGISLDEIDDNLKANSFVALYKIIHKSMFIAEYEGYNEQFNIGAHFLLSPKFKLDIFVINLNKKIDDVFNNVFFGLSFLI